MIISKEQLRTLSLNKAVVTDVTDVTDEKMYQSGDGILIDDNNKINVNYSTISARLTSFSDPFVLSSQIEKTPSESNTTYSDGVKKDGTTVKANYTEISTALRNLEDPFALKLDVTDETTRAENAERELAEAIESTKTDILTTTAENYVDLTSNQTITGKKRFEKSFVIGHNNQDTGNYCFGTGTDLTVGSYSWFFTGIDISADISAARIYLCAKQPRYPFPFCIFNGDKTKFRMCRNTIDLNDPSTLSGLSSSTWGDSFILPGLWKLSAQNSPLPPYRDDYNQLSSDLGDKYYELDSTAIINQLSDYLDKAFTEDKNLSVYNLKENCPIGAEITMVNNWKIEYARCGKVTAVGDGYIDVKLTDTVLKEATPDNNKMHSFVNIGIDFTDLDYDDASLVFIDYPSMPGPSTEATYASMTVGNANTVLRRCSFAAGKENKTESDFCVALGRKAEAKDFCSFVWAPACTIKSPKAYSFTIGLPDNTLKYLEQRMLFDWCNTGIYVADKEGNSEPLPTFVWNCITADTYYESLLQRYFKQNADKIKQWLGL